MKGTYSVKFNKSDEGALDEIFTIPVIEVLEKADTPIIYNETHFVEDVATIRPSDFKELDPKITFTPNYSLWNGLTGILRKPCGTATISLPLLKCKPLIEIYLRGKLKQWLHAYRLDHTLTTLKADGTLSLFKVEREK